MYDQGVQRLRAAGGTAGGLAGEMKEFADGLDGARWGTGVVSALQDAGTGAAQVEALYGTLADRMQVEGGQGAEVHGRVPWAPDIASLEGGTVPVTTTQAPRGGGGAARPEGEVRKSVHPTPAEVAAAAERELTDFLQAADEVRQLSGAERVARCAELGEQARRVFAVYGGAQMVADMDDQGLDQRKYAEQMGLSVNKVGDAVRAARRSVAGEGESPTSATAAGSSAAASGPAAAVSDVDAAGIVARLRETETEDEGIAYLGAQGLDRAGLLAVAAASGLTRMERVSRQEIRDRVIKQTIGARRKFAGLRKW